MSIESRRGNLETRRDILHMDRGVGKHHFGGGEVFRAERSGPTALLTTLTCGLEAGADPLADDGPLEFSQRTEDVERQPPSVAVPMLSVSQHSSMPPNCRFSVQLPCRCVGRQRQVCEQLPAAVHQ
jgi:hypothetical protein